MVILHCGVSIVWTENADGTRQWLVGMVCADIISMIICAMLVLFAMSAAELMKKRSGVCSANCQSIRSSQRSHIRASAKDGQCLQLPFSLLCASSHIINKFENKQMKAQARTPAAVPSAPEGSCVMLAPLLEWASAVSEPGSSVTRKTKQPRRQNVKT